MRHAVREHDRFSSKVWSIDRYQYIILLAGYLALTAPLEFAFSARVYRRPRRVVRALTVVVVLGFEVPVDGWLTKLSAPIVRYRPSRISGVRWPWDIPVEDFLFGFALLTLVLLLWERTEGKRA